METWKKHASRAACRLLSLAKLAADGRKRIQAGGASLLLRLVPCLGNRGNYSSNINEQKEKKKMMMIMMRKVRSEITEEGEDEGVWRKTILMGEKCQPLDFSGAIHYDSAGRQVSTPRTPFRSPAISFAFREEEEEEEGEGEKQQQQQQQEDDKVRRKEF